MSAEHLPLRLLLDDDDYRITECMHGWNLEYRDPCMHIWHTIALRSTVKACTEAYERLCDGQTVSYDDDEETA